MREKSFIITVDTEGDDLWSYKEGDIVRTENSLAIPRFQELCEKFQFKPVYLTNYEMINDDRFVTYVKDKVNNNLCEVGIHVHAWNNPPYYELEKKYNGNSYLIEYPEDIMRDKFGRTYEMIKNKLGINPVSHRAGRWAMNDIYFKVLKEYNIKIDCSYTPGIDWNGSPGTTINSGSNYLDVNRHVHCIDGILEVPMSIRHIHYTDIGSIKNKLKTLLFGKKIWLRPAISSLNEMKRLCQILSTEDNNDYIEFMIHSSELMAGGSPYFKNDAEIDNLYQIMESLFCYINELGYIGRTLGEYYITSNK